MRKLVPTLLCTLTLCLSVSPAALAADDAATWLDRMGERAAAGHYKMDFDAKVALAQEGFEGTIDLDGHANVADETRFHVEFDVRMSMGGMQMAMSSKVVSDGETFWFEMDAPQLGGTQILTGPTSRLGELAESQAMAGLGGEMAHDPIAAIRTMADGIGMRVAVQSADGVTLLGEIDPAKAEALGVPVVDGGTYTLTLVLDPDKAVPLSLSIGDQKPLITMNFSNYGFFDASSVDAAAYAYTPPEGATVSDFFGSDQ